MLLIARPVRHKCVMTTAQKSMAEASLPSLRNSGANRALASSRKRGALGLAHVREFTERLLEADIHPKRVLSIGNYVAGALHAATLSVHAIGQAYAEAAQTTPKHGVKQADRFLSNSGIKLSEIFRSWVPFVVGVRKSIVIAFDWTEFDADDHSTICAYSITSHGRATPLMWKSHTKSDLKGNQKRWEQEILAELHACIDESVEVTLLADRGFGDQATYQFLELFGWDYVIRFRGDIRVEDADGVARTGHEWVKPTGRAFLLRGAKVTCDRASVPAVVIVHDKQMKDSWCLATSLHEQRASDIVKLYGKRFSIEETFRDTKDIHFGLGLKATHIGRTDRRDRLLMLFAIAHALLTLLGAASERAGFDRKLKVNTSKKRTHSLFRQGTYWFGCLPTMREDWLLELMPAFEQVVREQAALCEVLGFI